MAAVALATACSGDGNVDASAPTSTTPATVTSTAPSSTVTTVASPSSTVISRPSPTTAAPSPEAFARALYDAWTKGDRAAAAKVAESEAVSTLFSRTWQAGDGWSFAECSGAAGSLICTWQRPAGQQLLLRVRNATGGLPVTVSEVRFQP